MGAEEYKKEFFPGAGADFAEAERAGAEVRAAALARLGFLLSVAQEPVNAAEYVVEAALQFFQWDASFLVLYDSETNCVNDLINIDTLQGRRQRVPAVLQNKPPSPMMKKVIEEGPQLVLRKEGGERTPATVPFGDTGRRSLSLMFVPVRLDNKCIGVLSVQSYERQAYNEKDLEALQVLADHAAGALGRLQAETELRASEERLRMAVDSLGLGTWDYTQASDQFSYSEICAEILGLERSKPISFETFLEQFQSCDEENPAKLLREILHSQGGKRVHLECRIRRPDNSERWVNLGAMRFQGFKHRLPGTVSLIGTLLDITRRKQVEDALRAAQGELRARAEQLEEMVKRRTLRLQETVNDLEHVSYALKHDMRAPLRAMQAYAQLIEEDLADAGRPTAMQYLRLIRHASQRLDQLIQDSLSYNRAVLGEMVLTPVDLGRLLAQLVETYPQLQPDKAEIRLEKGLPVVLGNDAALTQCFANLLDNAAKFVKTGEKPRIRVWAEPRADRMRIWVEDQGIGVSKRFRERIFDMFHRGSNEYEGTGIGLSIVQKLAQRLGGTVGVESEESKGSRFWVELKTPEA